MWHAKQPHGEALFVGVGINCKAALGHSGLTDSVPEKVTNSGIDIANKHAGFQFQEPAVQFTSQSGLGVIESCFLVMPYCNTACMNLFLQELSKQFPQDAILMCCDGAAWHKSGTLEVPDTIS